MKKPILIIFEGVDKTGKTTLLNEFNKITHHGYVALDRLITSSKVYNEIYGRGRFDYYNDFEITLRNSFNVLYVYCVSDNKDINERLSKANESMPKELSDFVKVNELFERYLYDECGPCSILMLNTSNISIEECIKKILNSVKIMEESNAS